MSGTQLTPVVILLPDGDRPPAADVPAGSIFKPQGIDRIDVLEIVAGVHTWVTISGGGGGSPSGPAGGVLTGTYPNPSGLADDAVTTDSITDGDVTLAKLATDAVNAFDPAGAAAAVTATSIGAVPVARSITAGAGLTGGGDLSANRTIDVGAGTGIIVNANDIAIDPSSVVLATRTITAGAGLTGGGNLSADRTIDVGAGTGITVNANDIAVDPSVVVTLTGVQTISNKTLGSALAAGGNKITGLAAATANGDAVRFEQLTTAVDAGRFSDGSDGAIVVGAGTTTLTTDKNPTTVVVQSGGILRGQVRVAASVSITIDAGGTIDRKGGDAAGSTAGAVVHTAVSLGIGSAGGAGGTAAGSAGGALSQVAKVTNGGAGGAGTGGAGGAGGVGSAIATTQAIYRGTFFREFLSSIDVTGSGSFRFNGGAGGGGGGGNGVQAGGGGGGGGSCGVFVTPTFINNGTVTFAGGNGAAGTAVGCGGGGGGNGGVGSIMARVYTNNSVVTVAAGTGGASGGAGGSAGSNGTDGLLLVTQL